MNDERVIRRATLCRVNLLYAFGAKRVRSKSVHSFGRKRHDFAFCYKRSAIREIFVGGLIDFCFHIVLVSGFSAIIKL